MNPSDIAKYESQIRICLTAIDRAFDLNDDAPAREVMVHMLAEGERLLRMYELDLPPQPPSWLAGEGAF